MTIAGQTEESLVKLLNRLLSPSDPIRMLSFCLDAKVA